MGRGERPEAAQSTATVPRRRGGATRPKPSAGTHKPTRQPALNEQERQILSELNQPNRLLSSPILTAVGRQFAQQNPEESKAIISQLKAGFDKQPHYLSKQDKLVSSLIDINLEAHNQKRGHVPTSNNTNNVHWQNYTDEDYQKDILKRLVLSPRSLQNIDERKMLVATEAELVGGTNFNAEGETPSGNEADGGTGTDEDQLLESLDRKETKTTRGHCRICQADLNDNPEWAAEGHHLCLNCIKNRCVQCAQPTSTRVDNVRKLCSSCMEEAHEVEQRMTETTQELINTAVEQAKTGEIENRKKIARWLARANMALSFVPGSEAVNKVLGKLIGMDAQIVQLAEEEVKRNPDRAAAQVALALHQEMSRGNNQLISKTQEIFDVLEDRNSEGDWWEPLEEYKTVDDQWYEEHGIDKSDMKQMLDAGLKFNRESCDIMEDRVYSLVGKLMNGDRLTREELDFAATFGFNRNDYQEKYLPASARLAEKEAQQQKQMANDMLGAAQSMPL